MLSVNGVHQAPEVATASPAHVSSIAAASKLRVTGTQTENMAFYLRTFSTSVQLGARGEIVESVRVSPDLSSGTDGHRVHIGSSEEKGMSRIRERARPRRAAYRLEIIRDAQEVTVNVSMTCR
jgi:hypothetical protein